MKRAFILLIFSVLFITCKNNPTPTVDEDDTQPVVWEMTSDTTAVWTGSEASVEGTFLDTFEENSDLEIVMSGFPYNDGFRITAYFGYDVGYDDVTITQALDMYSEPLTTDVLKLDKRSVDSQSYNFELDLNLSGVAMLGTINCAGIPDGVEKFTIIYEDAVQTFMSISFESHGMEEMAKKILCN